MGGLKATQRFAKYYLLPGVGHCGGGAPDTFAGLSSVVRWTEKGNAPGSLEAAEYSSGGTSGGLPGGGPPSGGPPSGPGGPGSSASRIPSLGASASGSPSRTIELYPYPEIPAYSGHGTVDDASSYKPTLSTALTNVIPWLGRFNTTTIWCNANGVKCTRKT